MTRRERLLLGVVLATALVLRLFHIFELRSDILFENPPLDEDRYVAEARNFANDRPYEPRAFWQPPGILYALGLVMRIAGDGLFWPRVVQALVGTLICALSFEIARRLFDVRVGLLTAAILAVHGALIFTGAELLPAMWACAFDAVALLLLLDARESLQNAAGAGLALGLSALFTPVILPFAILVAVVLARGSSRSALAMIAGVAIPIVPIAIRNHELSNHWVLVSTNGGLNFYIGNNERYFDTLAVRPGVHWVELADELPARSAGVVGEVPRSRWFLDQGLQFWTAHPAQALGLYLRKLCLYFHGAEIPRDSDLYDLRSGSRVLRALIGPRGFWFPDGLLMPLALVGVVTSIRDRARLVWPLLFVALQAAVVALFFVSARYRVPALPMLVLFAVLGARAIFRAAPRQRTILAGVALLLAVILSLPTRETKMRFSAEPDLHRGVAHRRLGDATRAIEAFRRSTAADPSDARPWFELGGMLRDPIEAATAFERAAQLDPRDLRANRMAAVSRMRANDRDAAIRLLRANVGGRVGPEHVEDHMILASIRADGGELDAALTEIANAVRCHPPSGRKRANDFANLYRSKISDEQFWKRFAEVVGG
jgi:4-amino-4-deoxy-L-arabinose transferase-like glycosyltransferase